MCIIVSLENVELYLCAYCTSHCGSAVGKLNLSFTIIHHDHVQTKPVLFSNLCRWYSRSDLAVSLYSDFL